MQNKEGATDLFVPDVSNAFVLKKILERLRETGHRQVALTTLVYGRPTAQDRPAPLPIYKNLKLLRRLHVVVETVAEVGNFSSNSPIAGILNQYDLVSLSPRNDAAFEAACKSNADIISLDCSAKIRIKTLHVKLVTESNAVFELPYAAALLDPKSRRRWVELSHNLKLSKGLQMKRRNVPNLLVSSGPRKINDEDAGPLAIRRPDDIRNLVETVLGLRVNNQGAAHLALEHARVRKYGKTNNIIRNVRIAVSLKEATETQLEEMKDDPDQEHPRRFFKEEPTSKKQKLTDENDDDDNGEKAYDGFIAF